MSPTRQVTSTLLCCATHVAVAITASPDGSATPVAGSHWNGLSTRGKSASVSTIEARSTYLTFCWGSWSARVCMVVDSRI
ncbi:hypothetical protein QFZ76_000586 [Streptomyces sp. V4I2]|nr:hypothetical protein [Streptomyces sp. V4I2]